MNEPLWGSIQRNDSQSPRPLILVLHGSRGSRASVCHAAKVAMSTHPDADLWVPRLPHSKLRNFFGLAATADRLKQLLDEHWSTDYDELIIIGHSTGGPLARALYLAGALADRPSPWVDCLKKNGRIVMLAGMNRGWKITHHLSIARAIKWKFGALVGHFLALLGKRLTLFDLRRGSYFLTKMRFEWLQLAQKKETPLTVQLLGSIDDMVGPEDAIDLVTGANFRYLDVPASGHLSVLAMAGADPTSMERARILRIALGDLAGIAAEEVRPWGLKSGPDPDLQRRDGVDHVIFVIHGIRDKGFWTDRIARHIWKRSNETERNRLERVTSSYGYFGMGPFLFPWVRREKVEWLADQVLEAHARYPNAKFSYVGHSNGTYLLAGALETYGDIQGFEFEHVVFAGSVVSRDYDWREAVDRNNVKRVLNIVATRDWVVAFFPQFFELVSVQDLGSAGHNGFDQGRFGGNYTFADGGHGAGIDERFWDSIADFVLGKGGLPPRIDPGVAEPGTAGKLMRRLGLFTPMAIWALLVVLLFVWIPLILIYLWDSYVGPALGSTYASGLLAAVGIGVVVSTGIFSFHRAARKPDPRHRLRPWRVATTSSAVPLVLALAVWMAAQGAGLTLPSPEAWTPAVLTLYVIGLVTVLAKL